MRTASPNPSLPPSTNDSYTGTRLNSPYSGIPTIIAGRTKTETTLMISRNASMGQPSESVETTAGTVRPSRLGFVAR